MDSKGICWLTIIIIITIGKAEEFARLIVCMFSLISGTTEVLAQVFTVNFYMETWISASGVQMRNPFSHTDLTVK